MEIETISKIKELDVYEFYNVLWIEWKAGIAYRRVLGRIWREAWKIRGLILTDVILGWSNKQLHIKRFSCSFDQIW